MRSPAATIYGILVLIFSLVSLTGCDLLGLGPKKQDDSKKHMEAAAVAPATPAPQSAPAQGPLPNDALVRMGNWTLTSEEFANRLNLLKQQLPDFKQDDPNSKNAVLEELIRQQLLVKETEDSNLGDSKEIKDAIDDFRKTLLVQQIASNLTKDVVATEDDALKYYESNKDKFADPVTWNVSQIIAKDEAAAKNILVQVLQGGDFSQIAQTQSKATNATEGGKLKPFVTGKAPFDAMQTAIYTLDVGGVSGVFKGPEGYYIVKVNSKTGGTPKAFADVKKDLIYGLTMQKQQTVLLNHLKELADKDKPEYNKDLIDQVIGKVNQ